MILFVLEGVKRETTLVSTLQYLFFNNANSIIFSFNNNIYNLYKELKSSELELDIVSILREKAKSQPDNELSKIEKSSDISEIYLIFDYDGHNQNKGKNIDFINQTNEISELLDFFNDENLNGKLYINYPMIESLWYTKKLPDINYFDYTFKINQCKTFKSAASNFSYYPNSDFISFRIGNKNKKLKIPNLENLKKIKDNWKLLLKQNVSKANYICNNEKTIPQNKTDISQIVIFNKQKEKYIAIGEISILNSLLLYLYENLNINQLQDNI